MSAIKQTLMDTTEMRDFGGFVTVSGLEGSTEKAAEGEAAGIERAVELVKISHETTLADIVAAREFCQKLPEYVTNGFHWPETLMKAHGIEEFRRKLAEIDEKAKMADLEKGIVPQELWWVKNESGDLIGLVKIRTVLTPKLLRSGGHVGYGLAPEYRGQGYGSLMLQAALEKCRERGLHQVLVTTDQRNFASRSIIERNRGWLWELLEDSDGQRVLYWIPC